MAAIGNSRMAKGTVPLTIRRALVDVGYRDAGARIEEIEAFLAGAKPADRPIRLPRRSPRSVSVVP